MFCVLYACTACCLAVLDVVLHTSYGHIALLMFVPRHSWSRVLLSAVSPIPGWGVLLCV